MVEEKEDKEQLFKDENDNDNSNDNDTNNTVVVIAAPTKVKREPLPKGTSPINNSTNTKVSNL